MWMIFAPHVIGCVVGNLTAKVIEIESKMKTNESMKPGRELDALVAEKVFGCRVKWPPSIHEPGISQTEFESRRKMDQDPHCDCADRGHNQLSIEDGWNHKSLKGYSTDIAAAWELTPFFSSDSMGLKFGRIGKGISN